MVDLPKEVEDVDTGEFEHEPLIDNTEKSVMPPQLTEEMRGVLIEAFERSRRANEIVSSSYKAAESLENV